MQIYRSINPCSVYRVALLSGVLMCIISISTPLHAESTQASLPGGFKHLGPFEHNNVPGGIAIVPTGLPTTKPQPRIVWNKRIIATLPSAGEWSAIVGVPLGTTAGRHKLAVESGDESYQVSFEIEPKAYEEQRITISDKRKVNPAPLDMERITKENKRLRKVKRMRSRRLLALTINRENPTAVSTSPCQPAHPLLHRPMA